MNQTKIAQAYCHFLITGALCFQLLNTGLHRSSTTILKKLTGFYLLGLLTNASVISYTRSRNVAKVCLDLWKTSHPCWSCLSQHMRSIMHTAFTLFAPMLTFPCTAFSSIQVSVPTLLTSLVTETQLETKHWLLNPIQQSWLHNSHAFCMIKEQKLGSTKFGLVNQYENIS